MVHIIVEQDIDGNLEFRFDINIMKITKKQKKYSSKTFEITKLNPYFIFVFKSLNSQYVLQTHFQYSNLYSRYFLFHIFDIYFSTQTVVERLERKVDFAYMKNTKIIYYLPTSIIVWKSKNVKHVVVVKRLSHALLYFITRLKYSNRFTWAKYSGERCSDQLLSFKMKRY